MDMALSKSGKKLGDKWHPQAPKRPFYATLMGKWWWTTGFVWSKPCGAEGIYTIQPWMLHCRFIWNLTFHVITQQPHAHNKHQWHIRAHVRPCKPWYLFIFDISDCSPQLAPFFSGISMQPEDSNHSSLRSGRNIPWNNHCCWLNQQLIPIHWHKKKTTGLLDTVVIQLQLLLPHTWCFLNFKDLGLSENGVIIHKIVNLKGKLMVNQWF